MLHILLQNSFPNAKLHRHWHLLEDRGSQWQNVYENIMQLWHFTNLSHISGCKYIMAEFKSSLYVHHFSSVWFAEGATAHSGHT